MIGALGEEEADYISADILEYLGLCYIDIHNQFQLDFAMDYGLTDLTSFVVVRCCRYYR